MVGRNKQSENRDAAQGFHSSHSPKLAISVEGEDVTRLERTAETSAWLFIFKPRKQLLFTDNFINPMTAPVSLTQDTLLTYCKIRLQTQLLLACGPGRPGRRLEVWGKDQGTYSFWASIGNGCFLPVATTTTQGSCPQAHRSSPIPAGLRKVPSSHQPLAVSPSY